MQYHNFVLTPRVNRALAIINDAERLNSLSVVQLIYLKADLYNLTGKSMEELFEAFNSPHRKRLKTFNDMDYKEQKVYKGLEVLNFNARIRMKKIANDFKARKQTETYEDVHKLSFAFRNNGYNYANFPEITPMNSEVSWYKHMKKYPRQKSFWNHFSKRTIRNAIRVGKAAVLASYAFIGHFLLTDEKTQNNMPKTWDDVENVHQHSKHHRDSSKDYQLTSREFSNYPKYLDNSGIISFNHNKQNSNA